MADELVTAARQWQEEGFALVPGLVPTTRSMRRRASSPLVYDSDTFDDYNRARGFGDGDRRASSSDPRSSMACAASRCRGCPALNDLFVHPRLVAFAAACAGRRGRAHLSSGGVGEVGWRDQLRAAAAPGREPLAPPTAHGTRLLAPGDVPVPVRCRRGLRAAAARAAQPVGCRPRRLVRATRSSPPASGARCWPTARMCGIAAPTSPGPTRPEPCSWSGFVRRPRSGSATTPSGGWATAACSPGSSAGKSPDDLALFGIPRPGHPYWNAATVDAMAHKYPGLDVTPWLDAVSAG